MEQPYLFLDCNNYRLIDKNNKIINIINFGEAHGLDSKLDIMKFKDLKSCFYVEEPMRLFKKYYNYPVFIKHGSKKDIEYRKKSNMSIFNSKGYHNIYHLKKYFAYYYKKNKYIFEDKDDQKLVNESNPYNKLWEYCPCDYRDGIGYLQYCCYLLEIILLYYLRYTNIFNKDFIKNNQFDKYLKLSGYNIKYFKEYINPKSFEEFEQFHKKYQDKHPPYNKQILQEIYKLLKKYFNTNYYKFINNFNENNLNEYFKNINITQMSIDLFNIQTYFYYIDDLKKYKCIYEFINYYYNYYVKIYKDILNYYIQPISCYDIILYINLHKNLNKYDYHVIYNGDQHRFIFSIYIDFLKDYEKLKMI